MADQQARQWWRADRHQGREQDDRRDEPDVPGSAPPADLVWADIADTGLVLDPERSATLAWLVENMACVICCSSAVGWPSEASHRSHHLAGARWRRDVRGPVAPQPVEHQPDEAPPGLGCRRSGALDDAGVGHQQQDHILGDDVSPEGSIVLCPLDQADPEVIAAPSMGLQRPRIGERPGQDVLEPSVGRLHRADPLDIAGETGPGVVRLERLLGRASVLCQPVLEAGGDQISRPGNRR